MRPKAVVAVKISKHLGYECLFDFRLPKDRQYLGKVVLLGNGYHAFNGNDNEHRIGVFSSKDAAREALHAAAIANA